MSNTGDNTQQQEHSYITSGNTKWYMKFGKEFGIFI